MSTTGWGSQQYNPQRQYNWMNPQQSTQQGYGQAWTRGGGGWNMPQKQVSQFNQGPGVQIGGGGNVSGMQMGGGGGTYNPYQQPAASSQQQKGYGGAQYETMNRAHPSNAVYISEDGNISYNEQGQQLDSNGNVATGSMQMGRPSQQQNQQQQAGSNYWAQFYNAGYGGGGSGDTWRPPVPIGNKPQGQEPPMNSGEGDYGGGGGYPVSGYGGGLPFDWQQYSGAPDAAQATAQEWAQLNLPYQQFMQNAMQYGMDFQEAKRRWDAQFGYQQGLDQWQQGFSERQQTQAELQAQIAAQQWQQQFGAEQDQFGRQLGQQQHEFAQNYGLQRDQFGLQRQQWQADVAAQNRQMGMQEWLNQQQMGYRGQELNLQQQQQQQQYQLGGRELDLRDLQQQRELGLQRQQMQQQGTQFDQQQALAELQNMQKYGLDVSGLELQRQLGQAEIASSQAQTGINTRRMALEELTNAQRFGLDQRQMSLAEQEIAQKYGLSRDQLTADIGYRNQQLALQQAQLGQDATLTREQSAQKYQYEYSALAQAAQQEAARLGVDVQQIQNTDRYNMMLADIRNRELAQQGMLQTRQMGIGEYQFGQEQALQYARMAQERQQAEAQRAQDREMGLYGIFGRAQAPNARWMLRG